jgi:hypothetical protein
LHSAHFTDIAALDTDTDEYTTEIDAAELHRPDVHNTDIRIPGITHKVCVAKTGENND